MSIWCLFLLTFCLFADGPNSISCHRENDDHSISDEYCTGEGCPQLDSVKCISGIEEFKSKRLLTTLPVLDYDPYSKELDSDTERIMRSVIDDRRINCGVRFIDNDTYELRTFPNEYETNQSNFAVTHYGRCGACSSLQDLSVYLSLDKNLTLLGSQCSVLGIISDHLSSRCYTKLGFTESCARIWLYGAVNTRRHCWWPCLIAWLTNEAANIGDDEQLSTCLQCNRNHTSDIFKYHAGRTRSNSGIVTEIKRAKEEIRNVNHCY